MIFFFDLAYINKPVIYNFSVYFFYKCKKEMYKKSKMQRENEEHNKIKKDIISEKEYMRMYLDCRRAGLTTTETHYFANQRKREVLDTLNAMDKNELNRMGYHL